MKFQCGECQKYFTIKNIHSINNDLEFQCDNCANLFSINRNLVFSSSSNNSSIVCENCGKLIPETNHSCTSCNLILSKTHEELRIDNKYYESLEINEKGDVSNADTAKKLKKKKSVMPAVVVVATVLSTIIVGYLAKTDRLPFTEIAQSKDMPRIERQIIIMQSGQTYYATEVEENGLYLTITSENGQTTDILKSNVLQRTKAVIEE